MIKILKDISKNNYYDKLKQIFDTISSKINSFSIFLNNHIPIICNCKEVFTNKQTTFNTLTTKLIRLLYES